MIQGIGGQMNTYKAARILKLKTEKPGAPRHKHYLEMHGLGCTFAVG